MSDRAKILILGASGHARVLVDIVERQGAYEIAGFVDREGRRQCRVTGYQVLGTDDAIGQIAREQGVDSCCVAIGDNWARGQVVHTLATTHPELRFPVLVHPSASIGRDVTLGDGTVVMAGAIVNSGTRVGEFCILNTHSSLDHDCELSSFASLGPGAVVGGHVRIGPYSAVCLGARVVDTAGVGEHVVVGAGATVLQDIPASVVVYGTPARIIRPRERGEPYFK